MDDDDLIETIARGYSVAYGESPDEFVRTVKTKEQTRIRKWHLWVVSARAALAAIREARFAVVPVEPTDEMKRAGACAVIDDEYGMWIGNNWEMSEAAYRAMIAAAQEAKP